MLFGLLLLFVPLCLSNHVGDIAAENRQMAGLIDAGSSGTRLFFYVWDKNWATIPRVTPAVVNQVELSKKVPETGRGGIDTLAGKTQTDAATYFKPLKDYAWEIIPAETRAVTPLMIYATAGMRLVSPDVAKQIWGLVRNELSTWGFLFDPTSNGKTISGQEEGVFGWNTVNLLRDAMGGNDSATWAAFDMGGASTQVTYIPEEPPLDGYYENWIYNRKFPVYTHSYLGGGQDQMLRLVLGNLSNNSNPCDYLGYNRSISVGSYSYFIGTANPDACLSAIRKVLGFDYYCNLQPCAAFGTYMPPIPPTMKLAMFSSFSYNADYVGCYGTNQIKCFLDKTRTLCTNKNITEARALRQAQGNFTVSSDQFFDISCFGTLYDYIVLTEAYKLSPDRTAVFENIILNHEVGWAMGAVMSRVGLLRSISNTCPSAVTPQTYNIVFNNQK
eukprot:NODE_2207_length_1653_cov_166.234641_g1891_i0.p1 GENE.NODE_2207_length_1653_cov_166.234641_g1891_i0~~NODE_2207_length_1653_cov_166.234641_g1891_i0.p1  ORF type:complete len:444 (+),score=57.07 NODE_2207_length_1653_cov_166.234641_g1891_i0:58-1389(+)